MTHLSDYDYELPRELIAQEPVHHRPDARLMVVDRAEDSIRHLHVRDLPELLRENDSLVLNDTRVVPARLVGFRTETGGHWEGLFLQREEHGFWLIMSKTRGKLQSGETVTLLTPKHEEDVRLTLATKTDGGNWIVKPESEEDTWSILERVGRIPIPPYIRRGQMVEDDRESYQTVFAQKPGAVAAPTAGLHFTRNLLYDIVGGGTDINYVTLHVGIGTFRPIEVERLEEHHMHSEVAHIDADTVSRLNACRARGGRVVAVGTTCVRVLESAAASGTLQPFDGATDLFIRPPYEFKAVDALLTNFHLPKSSLLVLVRTFGGDQLLRRAYDEAIKERYRFFSYGDAMLIL